MRTLHGYERAAVAGTDVDVDARVTRAALRCSRFLNCQRVTACVLLALGLGLLASRAPRGLGAPGPVTSSRGDASLGLSSTVFSPPTREPDLKTALLGRAVTAPATGTLPPVTNLSNTLRGKANSSMELGSNASRAPSTTPAAAGAGTSSRPGGGAVRIRVYGPRTRTTTAGRAAAPATTTGSPAPADSAGKASATAKTTASASTTEAQRADTSRTGSAPVGDGARARDGSAAKTGREARAGASVASANASEASGSAGNATPTPAPTFCLGFDSCPEYPRPYSFGEWPKSYSYNGSFPDGFMWGMGTAAYQIEGAYREDGRGASIWDTFTGADTVGMPGAGCSYCCTEPPCPVNQGMADKGATGNVACNHYHTWKSDVALMKSMGLKHYRFSISWPRLVPTGRIVDGVNPRAKAFYNDLIDALVDADITPHVTLYHWDLPQGLLSPPELQGWWSRDPAGAPSGQILPDWLGYVDTCFKAFGDRVKFWITFNEAWTFTFLGSGFGKAPGIPELSDVRVDPYVAGHNVLNAHAAAVDLYRRKYKPAQGGKIGIANNCDWREPKTASPLDVAAAERAVEFSLGWFADPIFGGAGDYPPAMRRLYGARLPAFTEDQRRLINGSADFFGLNHYGTGWASFTSVPGVDEAYASISEEGLPRALSVWLYGAGWGFRKLLNWIDRRYRRPPIHVTEGGWSLPAVLADAAARDPQRVAYYANYTAAMRQAIHEDGVDVRGYFAWSLMDNFEWERGYVERFGTSFTDFAFGPDSRAPAHRLSQPTAGHQTRTRKDSSCWLEAVWSANALVDPAGPSFHGCVSSGVFNASFRDPEMPSCMRTVYVDGTGHAGYILGTDGADGRDCSGAGDMAWGPLPAFFSGGTVTANFAPRGGPADLSGYWNRAAGGIDWGDGRTWTALAEDSGVSVLA